MKLSSYSRTALILLAALSGSLTVYAQSADYHFVRSEDTLQDRNAYLLTLIAADPAARNTISELEDQ